MAKFISKLCKENNPEACMDCHSIACNCYCHKQENFNDNDNIEEDEENYD